MKKHVAPFLFFFEILSVASYRGITICKEFLGPPESDIGCMLIACGRILNRGYAEKIQRYYDE